ncbi:MAG: fahA [Pseudonocardiales bacterium]|nr:fahA [Pseudonocardiales bacterium]
MVVVGTAFGSEHAVTGPWLPIDADSPFPIGNLPYGAFTTRDQPETPRLGVAMGAFVLDLAPIATARALSYASTLSEPTLNRFMSTGPVVWADLRQRLTTWLTDPSYRMLVEPHMIPLEEVQLRMPFEVADYVDFYSSLDHATNLGRIFRPDQEPLTPNWKHLPIGYHGRAGTVCVSGTPVIRPSGQSRRLSDALPTLGPSRRLDIEAEVGFVVGGGSPLGRPVPLGAFADHVFGVCLVNDWSARDLQAWEYVPLGPFLGKSFLTSISPWIVPLAALEDARRPHPPREPAPLPYLDDTDHSWALDLTLEVRLNGQLISSPPFAPMYWTAAQQLAHMTVNGASLRTGDLYASGTVSGPDHDQRGSLIELSWNGEQPIELNDGTHRTFLEDGDEVVITATAPGVGGAKIGFGEVRGTVVPAHH